MSTNHLLTYKYPNQPFFKKPYDNKFKSQSLDLKLKKFLTWDLNNSTNFPKELTLNSNSKKINKHLSNRINSSLTKINKVGTLTNISANVSQKITGSTPNLTKTFFYSHSKNLLRKPRNMRFSKWSRIKNLNTFTNKVEQFFFKKTPRSYNNYTSTTLNSNRKITWINFERTGLFRWKSKQSPLINYALLNTTIFTISSDSSKDWYAQFFLKKINPLKSYTWLFIIKSLREWLWSQYNLFTNWVSLNKRMYLNNNLPYLTNFFCVNRLKSNTWLIETNKHTSNVSSTTNNLPSFKGKSIFSRSTTIITNMLPFFKKTTLWLKNHRLLTLARRYEFFLELSHAHHLLKYKKLLCIYYFPLKDFQNFSLKRISFLNKYLQLTASKSATNANRHIAPLKGLANTYNSLLNDNLLENFCDNHLVLSYTAKFKHQVYQLLARMKTELISEEHHKFIMQKDLVTVLAKQNINTSSTHKYNSLSSSFLILNNTRFNFNTENLYNNPLLFKYFFWNKNNLDFQLDHISTQLFSGDALADINKLKFSSRISLYQNTNLWPLEYFKYTTKRRVLKRINYTRFIPSTNIMWYYNTIVRFMEFYSGKKIYLNFNPFIENQLGYNDLALIALFQPRVMGFQRILGHRIFIRESVVILTMALRYKDPTFLSNWIKGMLYRMSFWKYRLLFRYIKHCMRYLFFDHFQELDFKGLKLTLNGKISVAGNARTRTLFYAIGETSHSTTNNRILSHFTTINSFTGVMGFRLTFYF